jgi:hypothetical protein
MDVAEKRITNEHVRGMVVGACGLTMDVAEKRITNEHVRGMVVETYHHGCLRRMCGLTMWAAGCAG